MCPFSRLEILRIVRIHFSFGDLRDFTHLRVSTSFILAVESRSNRRVVVTILGSLAAMISRTALHFFHDIEIGYNT